MPYTENTETFDTLYRAHWESVVRFCAARLRSLPDGIVEEVAQDVFLAAHAALVQQRYRGDGPLRTWLLGIAHNLCCKTLRDTQRRNPLRAALPHMQACEARRANPPAGRRASTSWPPAGLALLAYAHIAPPMAPEQQLVAGDPLTVMQRSFQRLARQDRQAYVLLRLHVVQGITAPVIAKEQGLSRATVYRDLARARAHLRQVYHTVLQAEEHGGGWS